MTVLTVDEAKSKLAELEGKTDPESIKIRNMLMLELTKHGYVPQPGHGVHEHFIADVRTRK